MLTERVPRLATRVHGANGIQLNHCTTTQAWPTTTVGQKSILIAFEAAQ